MSIGADRLSPTTLSYMAGVLDSIGLLTTRTLPNDTILPRVALHTKNTGLLQFFGERTGVTTVTTERNYMRFGCQEHCAEKHRHIRSVSGRWAIEGAKATILLFNLERFLRLQRSTAHALIEVGLRAEHKRATLEKMRMLGWEVPEKDRMLREIRERITP